MIPLSHGGVPKVLRAWVLREQHITHTWFSFSLALWLTLISIAFWQHLDTLRHLPGTRQAYKLPTSIGLQSSLKWSSSEPSRMSYFQIDNHSWYLKISNSHLLKCLLLYLVSAINHHFNWAFCDRHGYLHKNKTASFFLQTDLNCRVHQEKAWNTYNMYTAPKAFSLRGLHYSGSFNLDNLSLFINILLMKHNW